jgi:hypothetical protein
MATPERSSRSRCLTLAGPPEDELVRRCSSPVTDDELEAYVGAAGFALALLVPETDEVSVGYDLWFLVPADDGSETGAYTAMRRVSIRIERDEDGDVLYYQEQDAGEPVSVEEALDLAYRASSRDLLLSKRVYESRDCARRDASYALSHVLSDLDGEYMALLGEYESEPDWHSALSLFLFVSLTGLALERSDVSRDWSAIEADLVNAFGEGSAVGGDREELDEFIAEVGDLLLVVRKELKLAEDDLTDEEVDV